MRIDVSPQAGHPDVTLRALVESDIDQWYDYLRLPEVFQHTSWNLKTRD